MRPFIRIPIVHISATAAPEPPRSPFDANPYKRRLEAGANLNGNFLRSHDERELRGLALASERRASADRASADHATKRSRPFWSEVVRTAN